jgi:hypothetical protein
MALPHSLFQTVSPGHSVEGQEEGRGPPDLAPTFVFCGARVSAAGRDNRPGWGGTFFPW